MARFYSTPVNSFVVCVLLFTVALSLTSAFVVPGPSRAAAPRAHALTASTRTGTSPAAMRYNRRAASAVLRMAEEDVVEAAEEKAEQVQEVAQDASQSVRSFFAPNENVRLGSSRDQDGKSNVWAVEPKMRVEGTDVEAPEKSSFLSAAGILGVFVVGMAAIIAFLPAPDSL